MRFNTRNAYYLRISETTILPLYLYLDEQHVEWMSERVLQHVLADLRPLIIPKLIAEENAAVGPAGPSNAKKGTLDVHRGETYQFGYFLRNTEPHSVLIKTRQFTAAPPKERGKQPARSPVTGAPNEPQPAVAPNTKKRSRKSTRKDTATTTAKKRRGATGKGKGKQKATVLDSDEEEAVEVSADEDDVLNDDQQAHLPPRRSTRRRAVPAGGYRGDEDEDMETGTREDGDADVEMAGPEEAQAGPESRLPVEAEVEVGDPDPVHNGDADKDMEPTVKGEEPEPILSSEAGVAPDIVDELRADDVPLDVDLDEEEEKPKPIMKLRYQGFSIGGRCLCVIVEPYPPLRRPPRQMSLAPTGIVAPRAPSIAPADFVPSGQRAKTPLFLPEDDRDRSVTPAPWHHERERPPVPLFDEAEAAEDEDEADGGMLAFSQILKSVGEYAAGTAEDDDDIEGAVFLGDADEARGM